MPCARWSICQQQRSPFWNLSSVISTTTTAVALHSFRYPKICGSELVPCAVVDRVGWFKKWVFQIPVFSKSVGNCWNFILPVPNVASQDSNKRANTLGANCCSQTINGVSPSSQPIPLVAPVLKKKTRNQNARLQIFGSTRFPKFRSPARLVWKPIQKYETPFQILNQI